MLTVRKRPATGYLIGQKKRYTDELVDSLEVYAASVPEALGKYIKWCEAKSYRDNVGDGTLVAVHTLGEPEMYEFLEHPESSDPEPEENYPDAVDILAEGEG